MMKHIKYLLLIMAIFSIGTVSVYAINGTCSNAAKRDLSKAANYIKADYIVKDNSTYKTITANDVSTEYKIPNYSFEISVYNIVPEIYIEVTNKTPEVEFNIANDMAKDGIYTFANDDFGTIYNYKLIVYSNSDECYGEKLRTIKLTKPRYNAYSEFNYCKNSSSYYCQKFVGTELGLKGIDDFYKKIEVNNKKNSPETNKKENIVELFKSNWKIYLIAFSVVVALFVGLIVFLRYRNKRKGIDF